MGALLTYDAVDVCYDGRPVLRQVSFALQRGEILGVVGESGSGKSTLLRAALGLLGQGGHVTGGAIRFEGRSLTELPEREMRRLRGAEIGMIFQDAGASLCPVRTIGSQIYESMAAHGQLTRAQAKERGLELFDRLRLREGRRIWDSYPFELSGGMNQRVGIALAMLLHPRVLLADEPTSALDTSARRQVIDTMLQAREMAGTAIVLVTHDIGLVSALADTVLVLREGGVRERGSAGQVLASPADPYTRELLAAVPRLRRT